MGGWSYPDSQKRDNHLQEASGAYSRIHSHLSSIVGDGVYFTTFSVNQFPTIYLSYQANKTNFQIKAKDGVKYAVKPGENNQIEIKATDFEGNTLEARFEIN